MFSIPIATAAAVAGPTVAAVGAIAYAYRHPNADEVDEYGRHRRRSSWFRSTPEELGRRRSLEYEDRHPHSIMRDSTMSHAKQELEQTSEDIGSAARAAGDRVSSAGQQTMDKARDVAQSVRGTAESAWDKTRDTAESAWDKARDTEASAMNKTRSWFGWATSGSGSGSGEHRGVGSDEAREQRVADTASDIAASSRGSRRDFSDAASRAGSAISDMATAASDTVQRTVSEGVDASKPTINQMKNDMDDTYQDAKERAVDSANDAFNAAEEQVSNVGHAMADRAHQAADTMDSALRRTPAELQRARAADGTVVESREVAWEAGGPEGSGVRRASRRVGMDPYNESKWMRRTGVNFGHNSEHRWLD
ncbi:hypothetical protein BDF22DRAFT_682797 [Syncephalis plumigaleata]|nr:hypothetical protein BDF22DRAFT_682797 [Syncephalis plumigaleata]